MNRKNRKGYNLSEVIKLTAKDCNYHKYEVEDVVNSFLRVVTQALQDGYNLSFSNFAIFTPGHTSPRKGSGMFKGTEIESKPKIKVRFSPNVLEGIYVKSRIE